MKKIKIFLCAALCSLGQMMLSVLSSSAEPLLIMPAPGTEAILVSPPTGDNSYLILMIGAAICVVLIAIVIAMGKRRK